jgi:zinc/manganese transport system substrate-binding protein
MFPGSSKAQETSVTVLTSIPLIQKISQEMYSGSSKMMMIDSLINQEQSMHTYSLKPSDLNKLAKANVFFIVGLGFENLDIKLLKSKFPNLKIIVLSDFVPYLKGKDPHIWNHPLNMIAMAKRISEELVLLNPNEKSIVQKNLAKFDSDFSKLHDKYLKEFSSLKNKKIVVSHNSFGYLELAYGLEILSPSGFASHDQSKPTDISRIKKLLIENKQVPLFKEKSANNIFIEQLSKSLTKEIAGTLDGEDFLYKLDKKTGLPEYFEANLSLILKSLK